MGRCWTSSYQIVTMKSDVGAGKKKSLRLVAVLTVTLQRMFGGTHESPICDLVTVESILSPLASVDVFCVKI